MRSCPSLSRVAILLAPLSATLPALMVGALAVLLPLPLIGSARADEFDVPEDFATLQDAVAAAEVSPDVENNINITDEVIFTNAQVILGSDFRGTRRLTIRPDPGAAFDRATIASTNGCEPIITMTGAGYVTLQDLDIVRYTTNCNHLIVVTYAEGQNNNITIERCRIGSIWTTPGSAGWDYLNVRTCYDMIVRNCLFFSYVPANFDRGIHVFEFADPANSIRLYNNVVADYRLSGIVMHDMLTGAILLRNNVVCNHPDAPAAMEPMAYRSGIGAGPAVISSHNTAFASPAKIEDFILGGFQSIAGVADNFIALPRPDVDLAFVERTWDLIPAWDPNVDFWRLEADGPLHDEDDDWGRNVDDGLPDPADVAVRDDIERDFRPGGAVLHTDRGADQIEAGLSAVADRGPAGSLFRSSLPANPSPRLDLDFAADRDGLLTLGVYDVSGRRLHEEARRVAGGETGRLVWDPEDAPGIVFYRLKLETEDGRMEEEAGRAVIRRR